MNAQEFVVPIELEDLELARRDYFFIDTSKCSNLVDESNSQLQDILDGISANLLNSVIDNENVPNQVDNDYVSLYCFIRDFKFISDDAKARLFDILCRLINDLRSSFENEESQGQGQLSLGIRNAFKIAIFFLFSAAWRAESTYSSTKRNELLESKPKNPVKKPAPKKNLKTKTISYDWNVIRENVLSTLVAALSIDLQRLWNFGVPDQDFSSLFTRLSFKMHEVSSNLRNKLTRTAAIDLIVLPYISVPGLAIPVCTAVLQHVGEYEHLSGPMAELCLHLAVKHNTTKLSSDLLREIGRINGTEAARNAAGLRNTSNFLSELCSLLPGVAHENLPLLLPHLGSEPYVLRSALVTCIASIISASYTCSGQPNDSNRESFSSVDLQRVGCMVKLDVQARDTLMDILEERAARDCSGYTRAASLRAWVDVCAKGALPLTRVPLIACLATDRLRDRSAIVRRAAAQLLGTLLENNPYGTSINSKYHLERISEIQKNLLDESLKEDEISTMEREASFHKSALAFSASFAAACPRLDDMLRSRSSGDTIEGLRLLVRANRFNLPGATEGLQKSLSLVWHSDAFIREEASKAFVEAFVSVSTSNDNHVENEDDVTVRIAHNLVVIIARSNNGDLASLEEIVSGLIKNGTVGDSVFEQLWEAAGAKEQKGWARAAALRALAMGINADSPHGLEPNRLHEISSVSLGKVVQESRDWISVRGACILLEKCPPARGADQEAAMSVCIRQISSFLQGAWCCDSEPNAETSMQSWFSAAESALGAIFRHSPRPEQTCSTIIHTAMVQALCMNDRDSNRASAFALARLCFLVGHSALRLLVYTEDLASRLKKARGGGIKGKRGIGRTSIESNENVTGKEDGDDELGIAAEQDADDEKVFHDITEKEIVGRNLLGLFGPLLARIVANEDGSFGHPLLRESAILALSKYMCVSGALCMRYLDLLFTTLAASSTQPKMRSTVIVALGDLAFRFPNALEPWNGRMFERLKDEAPSVRANALLVLTHLILNDMVKVKGLVSDMALCLRDPVERLRDIARLFFSELSKRGDNPIYNLLPDIVSRLSQEKDLPPEGFREIMGFLLEFIKKDAQADGLLEKLCIRIVAASDEPQQCRDLSYCLAQLQITEKGMKRLAETVMTYKDALGDPEVYSHFQTLATRAKKFAKPELRVAVEEWEAQMAELHKGGAENENATKRAVKVAPLVSSRNSRASIIESSTPVQPVKPQKPATQSRKQVKARRPQKAGNTSRTKKNEMLSESDEEMDNINMMNDSESDKENVLAPLKEVKTKKKLRKVQSVR